MKKKSYEKNIDIRMKFVYLIFHKYKNHDHKNYLKYNIWKNLNKFSNRY